MNILIFALTTLQCQEAYQEAYNLYRQNVNTGKVALYIGDYYNAHNAYVLHLHASNRQESVYHDHALPYLQEVGSVKWYFDI